MIGFFFDLTIALSSSQTYRCSFVFALNLTVTIFFISYLLLLVVLSLDLTVTLSSFPQTYHHSFVLFLNLTIAPCSFSQTYCCSFVPSLKLTITLFFLLSKSYFTLAYVFTLTSWFAPLFFASMINHVHFLMMLSSTY